MFEPVPEEERRREQAKSRAMSDAMSDEERQAEWAHVCDYCRAVLVPSPVPLCDDPEPVCCPLCRAKGRPGSAGEQN
jgi:hypothetical protein